MESLKNLVGQLKTTNSKRKNYIHHIIDSDHKYETLKTDAIETAAEVNRVINMTKKIYLKVMDQVAIQNNYKDNNIILNKILNKADVIDEIDINNMTIKRLRKLPRSGST